MNARTIFSLFCLLFFVFACKPNETSSPPGEETNDEKSTLEEKHENRKGIVPAEPLEPPIQIIITNQTGAVISVDETFGAGSFLRMTGPEGRPAMMSNPDCSEPCPGEFGCMECARPETRMTPISPGSHHSIPWDGRFRVLDREGCCYSFVAPEPGTYQVQACAEGGGCGRATFVLPLEAGAEISLSLDGTKPKLSGCDSVDEALAQRAAHNTLSFFSSCFQYDESPVKPDLAQCKPEEVRCVDTLESVDRPGETDACIIVLKPDGERLEGHVFFPDIYARSFSYGAIFDAEGIRIERVLYHE